MHKENPCAHAKKILLLVMLFSILLRLGVVYFQEHVPESDEIAYIEMAKKISSGGVLDDDGWLCLYNAGYPLLVVAPVFYLTDNSLFAVKIVNILLGCFSIYLCYRLALEMVPRSAFALLAAALWALYFPAAVYSNYILKENLMAPLMLGVVYFSMRLYNGLSFKDAFRCGLCYGALALTGNAGLLLLFSTFFFLYWHVGEFLIKVKCLVLVFVVAIAVCSPWLMRNYYVIDQLTLNTNGGFNLYLGNNPAATGWFVSIKETPRGESWQKLWSSNGLYFASQVLKSEAIVWIIQNPTDFIILALKKTAFFWKPPIHLIHKSDSLFEVAARLIWLVQYLFLLVLACRALLLSRLRNIKLLGIVVAVACYALVHSLFYVTFRYRLPVIPLIAILAAYSICHFRFFANNPKLASHG
jgi:4-amino-4-deoxy-L-arabinose transferase-like glycosyltransferase